MQMKNVLFAIVGLLFACVAFQVNIYKAQAHPKLLIPVLSAEQLNTVLST